MMIVLVDTLLLAICVPGGLRKGVQTKNTKTTQVRHRMYLLCACLIFVISFTRAGFLNPNILHPKTTENTHKLQEIPPQIVKKADFRVQSGKIYTWQNFFTRALPVMPVTNMRYVYVHVSCLSTSVCWPCVSV